MEVKKIKKIKQIKQIKTDHWKAHEQEFLSKIRPRWTYHGPVKEVSGKELEELAKEGGTE